MVQSLESRIHKLLLEHNDALKVADILLKDWDKGNLSWMEQNSVGHFLVRAGFLRAYFDQVCENLKTGQKIPWSSFAEALAISKTKLSKEDFDQIFVGASDEQSLKDLVKCSKLDHLDSRFQKIRNSMDHTILRNENTPPPTSAHANDAKTQTVQKQQTKSFTPSITTAYNPEITSTLVGRILSKKEDENKSLKIAAKEIFLEALAKDPGHEKEAAIALGMMEAWAEGLEILRTLEPTYQNQLLELEFLLNAEKHIEALSLAERLLNQGPNLEQKSYIQFIQAQTLVKLKRPNEAYAILKNLIEENPDHLGARSLLNQIRVLGK